MEKNENSIYDYYRDAKKKSRDIQKYTKKDNQETVETMGICRSMHELTNSVNSKADIWASEGKILKSTHDLTKSCGIREWVIRLYSNFEGETEVSTGLQEVVPARVRMSKIYLCWRNIRPIPVD